MAKSLNKVMLIGNLTRDPEMRYTPQGSAVCTFGLATNRDWKTETGEKKEDVEFHNLVAWGKLAEICSNLLKKGRKAYVEGRLSTRSWQGQDGAQKQRTEIVITDMLVLDRKDGAVDAEIPEHGIESQEVPDVESKPVKKEEKKEESVEEPEPNEEDIPF